MLVRLAKVVDYVPSEYFAGMYQVKWCDYLCPGNPTSKPEEGVELFNAWQQLRAHDSEKSDPLALKLTNVVKWCLGNRGNEVSIAIAAWIVQTYKRPELPQPLGVDEAALDAETRGFVLDVQFAREEIGELPGSAILALQNMIHEEC